MVLILKENNLIYRQSSGSALHCTWLLQIFISQIFVVKHYLSFFYFEKEEFDPERVEFQN